MRARGAFLLCGVLALLYCGVGLGAPLGHPETPRAIHRATSTVCPGPTRGIPIGQGHTISTCTPEHCSRSGQRGATATGRVYSIVHVARSCACSAYNALVTRHLKFYEPCKLALPCPAVLTDAIAFRYGDCVPHNRDAWLAKWTRSKQRAILASEHSDERRPGWVKCTVKREIALAEISSARAIQAYWNLNSQAAWAVEHTAFQKALFATCGGDAIRGFEVYPGIFVAGCSGWPAERYSQWADEVAHAAVCYYERDGSRWDATMQRCHHQAKWDVMRACDPAFASAVESEFVCDGRFGHGTDAVRYRACGTVKSGHNDTTSGNTLINMLITAAAMRDCGVTGCAVVMGDDLLVAVTNGFSDFAALARREREYGIEPVYEVHSDLAEASFVSGIWLRGSNGHIFAPMPGRMLAKLWWTVNPPTARRMRDYCNGVALGLLATYSGVPIIDGFLRPYVQQGCREYVGAYSPHALAGSVADRVVGLEAAFTRYGLAPGDVVRLNDWLMSQGTEASFLSSDPWGHIPRMIARDSPKAAVGTCAYQRCVDQRLFEPVVGVVEYD